MIRVPANEIAEKLGADKIANMVMLGSYLAVSNALPVEAVIGTMKAKLAKKQDLVSLNEAAIQAGRKVAAEELAQ